MRVSGIRRSWPAALLIVAVACGGSEPAPPAPTVSPSPTATAAGPPVTSGSATVSISGEESFRMELAVSAADSRFAPGAGDFTFIFKDPDNNLISLGGDWFEGTRRSSGRLAVSLVFNRQDVIAHTDTDGGCEVTITRTSEGARGSFRCGEIEGGRYAAEGNFRVVAR